MKTNRIYAILLCLLSLTFPHQGRPSENDPLKIKFYSVSYISLSLANVMEPFTLQLEYYPNLSRGPVSTGAYSIAQDTTILLPLTTHMAQKQTFKIEKMEFPVFIAINDTTDITLDLKYGEIDYEGKYKPLNDYYALIHRQSNIHRNKIVELHNSKHTPWELIYAEIDSIASIETEWLLNTPASLPKWFIELELKELNFTPLISS